MNNLDWDTYFIKLATVVSEKSKDPRVKVGCVIVNDNHSILSTGYNGFPRGVDESILDRWSKDQKLFWVEHAERNAVYNAAYTGVSLKNSIAYLNWEPFPCKDCTKSFIQAGIKSIIGPDTPFPGSGTRWNFDISKTMLTEAGVDTIIRYQVND